LSHNQCFNSGTTEILNYLLKNNPSYGDMNGPSLRSKYLAVSRYIEDACENCFLHQSSLFWGTILITVPHLFYAVRLRSYHCP